MSFYLSFFSIIPKFSHQKKLFGYQSLHEYRITIIITSVAFRFLQVENKKCVFMPSWRENKSTWTSLFIFGDIRSNTRRYMSPCSLYLVLFLFIFQYFPKYLKLKMRLYLPYPSISFWDSKKDNEYFSNLCYFTETLPPPTILNNISKSTSSVNINVINLTLLPHP